jgi:hypothetical protein
VHFPPLWYISSRKIWQPCIGPAKAISASTSSLQVFADQMLAELGGGGLTNKTREQTLRPVLAAHRNLKPVLP